VRVQAVAEGSPAAAAGVVADDVLVALDGTDVGDARALRTALSKKAHGETFRLRLKRGAETMEREGRFPDAGPEPALQRRAPFGTVEIRREGNSFDATTGNVASFDLLLGVGAVNPADPVVVRVNGVETFRGTVAPDLDCLLGRAAEDLDPQVLYWARVRVSVPPRAPAPR
jgi:hypothetical protein